jgi:hypothetical protein
MGRSIDRYMVAHCSYCREDKGRHTHRGSHSSSHDSRRRYLSYAYLEKSPIFEERAHKHNSRGSNGHRGSMFNVSLVQKGRDYSEEDQRHSDRGSNPKRRMALFH